MIWRVSYDEADDWIIVRCADIPKAERRVESSFYDLQIIARHVARNDDNPTFEFADNAEQFRAKILA